MDEVKRKKMMNSGREKNEWAKLNKNEKENVGKLG